MVYSSLPDYQVAPLLEELISYTPLGPRLRKWKIDVDYIIDSMEGKDVGDLLKQVGVLTRLSRRPSLPCACCIMR